MGLVSILATLISRITSLATPVVILPTKFPDPPSTIHGSEPTVLGLVWSSRIDG